MHNGFIYVDKQKMSKSKGNFFTVRDVALEFGYEPIRLLMLSSHYRSPINYSLDILTSQKNALGRLYNCKKNLENEIVGGNPSAQNNGEILTQLQKHKADFVAAMNDDLNTADALGALFNLVRDINIQVLGGGQKLAQAACELLTELCGVLGLLYCPPKDDSEPEIPCEVLELAEKRMEAKKSKDYTLADKLRAQIAAHGFRVEDKADGFKLVGSTEDGK
jgi:cysteinyl-tRNA synthetase